MSTAGIGAKIRSRWCGWRLNSRNGTSSIFPQQVYEAGQYADSYAQFNNWFFEVNEPEMYSPSSVPPGIMANWKTVKVEAF